MTFQINQVQPQTKGDMYHFLRKFNSKTLRADMIEVIKSSRNCSVKEARDTKTLKPTEVKMILEKYT